MINVSVAHLPAYFGTNGGISTLQDYPATMYNGIGLQTARGSGTNGHVQRNFAAVRPGKREGNSYKAEEDMAKLDRQINKAPNQEILDHERKRKIEVKCAELEEILEKQG